ncbi:hypothetical protein [Methylibium sp.]|uniref:hypothetical protein n=1 Tax=Methylibium sp. TaxID=2067992 RepID=UPI0025E801AF|nr:hypothetical protein [Methylibium sp.]
MGIRAAVWRVAPPREVRLTLNAIDAFLRQVGGPGGGVVRDSARQLAKEAERTVVSIRTEGMDPNDLALLLVSNAAGEMIRSGEHHVHRAKLSMLGTDLLRVFTAAVERRRELNYQSADEAADDVRWVQERVAEAG